VLPLEGRWERWGYGSSNFVDMDISTKLKDMDIYKQSYKILSLFITTRLNS
jgi:hypothetical protein